MDFLHYQRAYYNKVAAMPNPEKVTLRVVQVESTGTFTDFTGEGDREYTDYQMPCLYQRNISDLFRTRNGIEADVTCVVWIPALSYFKSRQTWDFSEIGGSVRLFDVEYDINRVIVLEPFVINGVNMAVAYELHLTGIK